MAIVAGVDFGTLSVRVTIVDTGKGRLGTGVAEYPLHRKKEDPDHATQSHGDHMRALGEAVQKAVASAQISGEQIAALAMDTTGSSVIPLEKNWSRSASTISGATTAPGVRLPSSPRPPAAESSMPSIGAVAFIHLNGFFETASLDETQSGPARSIRHCV